MVRNYTIPGTEQLSSEVSGLKVEQQPQNPVFTSISITNYTQLYNFIRGVKYYEYTDPDKYVALMNQILSYVKQNQPTLLDKFYDDELLLPIVPQYLWNYNMWSLGFDEENDLLYGKYIKKDKPLNSALVTFNVELLEKNSMTLEQHKQFIKAVLQQLHNDLNKEDFIRGSHIMIINDSSMLPGIYVTTNPIIIWVLALDPYVDKLYLNKVLLPAEVSYTLPTGKDILLSDMKSKSTTGVTLSDIKKFYSLDYLSEHIDTSGIRIAVVDTGIDPNHPWFEGRLLGVHSVFGDNGTDGNGHGTHVAGIISRLSDAKIYAVKVLSDNGAGSIFTFDSGLGYIYNNNSSLKIDIVNMSLGTLNHNCDGSKNKCPLCQMVSKLYNNLSIVSCVASGNYVPGNPLGVGDALNIPLCPGKVDTAFSVGSVNYDLEHSWFSRYDSTPHQTPKYSVFGESILSACSEKHIPEIICTSLNGVPVAKLSGTSMSTPVFSAILSYYFADLTNLTSVFKAIKDDFLYYTAETGKVLYPFSLIKEYSPKHRVTITVQDVNGQLLSGIEVGIDNFPAVKTLNGVAEFTDIPEGKYSLIVAGDNIKTYTDTIVVDRDLDLTVTVEYLSGNKSNLKVTVLDEVNDTPIVGATVVIDDKTLTTNSNGNCYVSDLDPSTYNILVSVPGYKSKNLSVELSAGSNSIVVKLTPQGAGKPVLPMFVLGIGSIGVLGGLLAVKGVQVKMSEKEYTEAQKTAREVGKATAEVEKEMVKTGGEVVKRLPEFM